MQCVPAGAPRGLRWGCVALTAVVAILAVTSDSADARSRRKHHVARSHAHSHGHAKSRAASVGSYNPPYAAIVVDAKTGSVLHQASPDSLRHPASLTKIMTLYLLFERLEAGRIALNTEMNVSEEASIQAPTKLGLKPGSTLRVEDAIKGLVTKSANDAAVVIAETLGGTEAGFARMMTQKAHALGMSNTTYHNASGLPDDEQNTTARDQALLGIAIQERFPKFYRYFSLPSFVFRGSAMRNHNHLLGNVEGVDGIKTGYTRASGFNLVTSVRRGPRHIVAVVLGGRSAGSRDARMRDLIASHIDGASTKTPAGPMVAATEPPKPALASAPVQLAAPIDGPLQVTPPPVAVAEATAAIPEDASAPIKPLKVKTLTVKLVPPKNAPLVASAPAPAPIRTAALAEPVREVAPEPAPPPAHHTVLGKLPAMIAAAKDAAVPSAKADEAPIRVQAVAPSAPSHHTTRGGWAIQIGAYEDEGEAKQKLSSAKSKVSGMIERAEGYIERTIKGAKTYYRARFAGFDRNQAENACKRLKQSDIACMALKI
jgi:D-alanyl-D-alanine carboxypeptidase